MDESHCPAQGFGAVFRMLHALCKMSALQNLGTMDLPSKSAELFCAARRRGVLNTR